MFVLAMGMVSPPLNTEDRKERRSAGALSDNSAQQCAADESGNKRDSCSDQRGANIAPRIFPAKDPSQRRIAQNALEDIGQKNAESRAHRAKARNEPEQAARCNRTRDRRMKQI